MAFEYFTENTAEGVLLPGPDWPSLVAEVREPVAGGQIGFEGLAYLTAGASAVKGLQVDTLALANEARPPFSAEESKVFNAVIREATVALGAAEHYATAPVGDGKR